MEKLNIEELEDPKKLAETLCCQMADLANELRDAVRGDPEARASACCSRASPRARSSSRQKKENKMDKETREALAEAAQAMDETVRALQALGDRVAALEENQATLRDRFAMAALQGLLADSTRDPTDNEAAKSAYGFADAMLWARKR